MSEAPTIEFVIFSIEEHPNKFLLVRLADQMATHYLNPVGMWEAMPEDIDTVFAGLVATGNLPTWGKVEEFEEDEDGEA